MKSREALENELARLKKRLKRKKPRQTDEDHNRKIAQSRVEKAENYLAFLRSQSPEALQSTIAKLETQQVQLAEQIASLQERVRFYNDLLLNRAEVLADAQAEVDRVTRYRDGVDVADKTKGLVEQWEMLKGLMNGKGN